MLHIVLPPSVFVPCVEFCDKITIHYRLIVKTRKHLFGDKSGDSPHMVTFQII
eukprot:TRINITY_DN202_c0_g1_i2.p2 TRINITY_DN202_c0_g1~~TRINITY_DN202_c0_g1_i2.p2  ORF type:complete len:53 (-),score=8.10 TRINITY_DN202_c0_g1_i2:464-622(-)